MKHTIYDHDDHENDLGKLRVRLSTFLEKDIDEYIAPYIKYKWEQDYTKNISSILDMINTFSNHIDLSLNINIDDSIEKMLRDSLLENYYSITELNYQFHTKTMPKGINFFPSKRYLNKLNIDNPSEHKLLTQEYIPTKDENYQSYLAFIKNQGYINRNNKINMYSIMEHQIKKILKSNCFIQDIFLNLLINDNSQNSNKTEYTYEEFIATFNLDEKFDIDKMIKSLKFHHLPFDPPYENPKRKIVVNNVGKELQVIFASNPEFLDLFNNKVDNRVSCTYQNMNDINKAFTNKIEASKQFENMYLFEKMTGANHCINLHYFLLPYIDNNYVLDFVDHFYNSLVAYPNICTRIFLLDEILCLLDNSSLPFATIEICQYLDSFQPLYKEKYDIMYSFLMYFIGKVDIERQNPKFNAQYFASSLLFAYQKLNLPWTLHHKGIFISSEAQRHADKYFVTNKKGKDKPTKLYKAIQNELLLLNHNSSIKD